MRRFSGADRLLLAAVTASWLGLIATATGWQAPPAKTEPAPAVPKIETNLLQLMRGILYPSSNVVFAAQHDLTRLEPVAVPSVSPNLLTSVYGGWEAVELAALALSESANLLMLGGRVCANGRPVPVEREDWRRFTEQLREAGRVAYTAARSRNQDAMIEAAGTVTESCSACHDVYRRRAVGDSARCLP
jgi:hypothetical protein